MSRRLVPMASRARAGREDDTRPARWTLRDEQRRLTRQKLAVAALDALGDDPSRADVRAWLEDAVSFWERHRALIEANEQALHVEHPVAEYWWGGFERAAEAKPRFLARWKGDDRERERVRIAALMMELERVFYFW